MLPNTLGITTLAIIIGLGVVFIGKLCGHYLFKGKRVVVSWVKNMLVWYLVVAVFCIGGVILVMYFSPDSWARLLAIGLSVFTGIIILEDIEHKIYAKQNEKTHSSAS